MATTLPVDLDAHESLAATIERLLAGTVGEPRLLRGLVDSVAYLLAQIAQDPDAPRALGVEVSTSPSLVEIRIPRGHIVDTLLYPLG